MLDGNDRELIDKYEKEMELYIKIPQFVAIILVIIVFIMGPAVVPDEASVFLFWLIGGAICLLIYKCLNIAYAKEVLKVLYLRNIAESQVIRKKETVEETVQEEE